MLPSESIQCKNCINNAVRNFVIPISHRVIDVSLSDHKGIELASFSVEVMTAGKLL